MCPPSGVQSGVAANRARRDVSAAGARNQFAGHILHRDVPAIGRKVRRSTHISHHNIPAGSRERCEADDVLGLDVSAARQHVQVEILGNIYFHRHPQASAGTAPQTLSAKIDALGRGIARVTMKLFRSCFASFCEASASR